MSNQQLAPNVNLKDLVICCSKYFPEEHFNSINNTTKFNVMLATVLHEKHQAGVLAYKELLKDVEKDAEMGGEAEQVLVAAFSSTRLRCIKKSPFDSELGYDCEPHKDGDCPTAITAAGLSKEDGQELTNAAAAAGIMEDLHWHLSKNWKDLYFSFQPTMVDAAPGVGTNMTVTPVVPGADTDVFMEEAQKRSGADGEVVLDDTRKEMERQLKAYGEAWSRLTDSEQSKTVYQLICYMPHIYTAAGVLGIDFKKDDDLSSAMEASKAMFGRGECAEATDYPAFTAKSWLAHVYLHFGRVGYSLGKDENDIQLAEKNDNEDRVDDNEKPPMKRRKKNKKSEA